VSPFLWLTVYIWFVEDEDRLGSAVSDSESADEVDVVSVPSSPPAGTTLSGSSSGAGSRLEPRWNSGKSVVRELLVLPPACSLLARVTAMHNYSSSRQLCTAPSSAAGIGVSFSKQMFVKKKKTF